VDDAAERGIQQEPADPQQAVDAVAHAQRLELPGLLEQPLRSPREAQDRNQQKERSHDTEARARACGRREDVPDRLRAAAGQAVALDDALGRALAPQLHGERTDEDHQRDHRRQRAGGQRDRTIEATDLLEPVDDAEHELRTQPERQGPHDALAIHAPPRCVVELRQGHVRTAPATIVRTSLLKALRTLMRT
jgi:hypothetical protein